MAFTIKNWEQFQHYHDRRPPWIKLYHALLDDLTFVNMSDRLQCGLLKLWMLAAKLGHPLPTDYRAIKERTRVTRETVEELVQIGWLIEVDDASNRASIPASNGASKPLADSASDASTHASPRARPRARERESTERENRTTPAATARARWTEQLAGEALEAATAYRAKHAHPDAFDLALVKLAEPMTGNGFGWKIVGESLVLMRDNGKEWHVGLCAGYCKRQKQGAAPALNGNGRRHAQRARNISVLAAHAGGQHG